MSYCDVEHIPSELPVHIRAQPAILVVFYRPTNRFLQLRRGGLEGMGGFNWTEKISVTVSRSLLRVMDSPSHAPPSLGAAPGSPCVCRDSRPASGPTSSCGHMKTVACMNTESGGDSLSNASGDKHNPGNLLRPDHDRRKGSSHTDTFPRETHHKPGSAFPPSSQHKRKAAYTDIQLA